LDGTVLAPALYQRRSLAAMLLAKTRVIKVLHNSAQLAI